METQQQNGKQHSGWKAAGRAASFVFLPRWFFSEASGAAHDVGRLKRMVLSILHIDDEHFELGPDWDTTMLMHGFTEQELRHQVQVRQLYAWICYVVMLANYAAAILYAPIGWITGSLFLLWYLQNTLTMTQIRCHGFCTVWQYLALCARYPLGLLPNPLPKGWRMLDKEPGKELTP